jgi:hypothetical protein
MNELSFMYWIIPPSPPTPQKKIKKKRKSLRTGMPSYPDNATFTDHSEVPTSVYCPLRTMLVSVNARTTGYRSGLRSWTHFSPADLDLLAQHYDDQTGAGERWCCTTQLSSYFQVFTRYLELVSAPVAQCPPTATSDVKHNALNFSPAIKKMAEFRCFSQELLNKT